MIQQQSTAEYPSSSKETKRASPAEKCLRNFFAPPDLRIILRIEHVISPIYRVFAGVTVTHPTQQYYERVSVSLADKYR